MRRAGLCLSLILTTKLVEIHLALAVRAKNIKNAVILNMGDKKEPAFLGLVPGKRGSLLFIIGEWGGSERLAPASGTLGFSIPLWSLLQEVYSQAS